MMYNNFFVLARHLGELCISKDVHIALAESCTGGRVSSLITDVAGSSSWFNGGAVVYTNAAKSALLDVDPELIDQYGAVSESVAKAMAQGALRKLQADFALSITGIAGPNGGSVEKPVGQVCFALADHKGVDAKTMFFSGGRESIRKSAALFAFEWMILHCANMN